MCVSRPEQKSHSLVSQTHWDEQPKLKRETGEWLEMSCGHCCVFGEAINERGREGERETREEELNVKRIQHKNKELEFKKCIH